MPREDTCFALCTLYPPVRASKHGRDVELQAARYSGRPAGLKTDIVKERKNTPPQEIHRLLRINQVLLYIEPQNYLLRESQRP